VDKEILGHEFIKRLEGILKPDRGGRVPVSMQVRFTHQGERYVAPVPQLDSWRIRPSESLVRALESLVGIDNFTLSYASRTVTNPAEAAYA
jgi:hypothetical protein